MKNKTKSNILLWLGLVCVGVGLGLVYKPILYIYLGVLCILASIGYYKK